MNEIAIRRRAAGIVVIISFMMLSGFMTGAAEKINYCPVERLETPVGYALPDSADASGFAHRFYVRDHLGNNRMVIDGDGGVRQIQHYYPFGLSFEVRNFDAAAAVNPAPLFSESCHTLTSPGVC